MLATGTSTGVRAVWPRYIPQHFTPPPKVTAHVSSPPAETAATPLVRPDTSTGVLPLVLVPSPSAPLPLLPQHFTPPPAPGACSWVTAQVCCAPALMLPIPSSGMPFADAKRGACCVRGRTSAVRTTTRKLALRQSNQCDRGMRRSL